MKTLFLFAIIMGNLLSETTEFRHFTIMIRDQPVGEIIAKKAQNKDLTVYETELEFSGRFLVKINLSCDLKMKWRRGILIESDFVKKKNGKTKTTTSVRRNGGEYNIYENGQKKRVLFGSILCTTGKLCFSEPGESDWIYSEEDDQFYQLIASGAGCYDKFTKDGQIRTFCYSNGQLEQISIQSFLADIEIVRQR